MIRTGISSIAVAEQLGLLDPRQPQSLDEQLTHFEIDHDLLRIGVNQCERMLKQPTHGPLSPRLGRLKGLAHDVCQRLTSHLDEEERFLEESLRDGSFQSTLFITLAQDSRKQIKKIVRLVESFPWQPDPQKAATVMDVLVRLVRQHVDLFEGQAFPYIARLHHLPQREPKRLAA